MIKLIVTINPNMITYISLILSVNPKNQLDLSRLSHCIKLIVMIMVKVNCYPTV